MRASQTALGRRRLRVGACLSLSGRYARFGRQVAAGAEASSRRAGIETARLRPGTH